MSTTLDMLSSGGFNVGKTIIGPVVSVALSGMLLKGFEYLEEGERALKLRNGNIVKDRDGLPKEYMPGRRYALIGYSVLKKVSKIPRSLDVESFPIDHGRQYDVKASVFWNVDEGGENSRRALYEAVNLDESVADFCRKGLTTAILATDKKDIRNPQIIFETMKEASKEDLANIGVNLLNLSSYNASLSAAEIYGSRMVDAMRVLTGNHEGNNDEQPENEKEGLLMTAGEFLALLPPPESEQSGFSTQINGVIGI